MERGKGDARRKRMDMSGDPWRIGGLSSGLYILLSLPLVSDR